MPLRTDLSLPLTWDELRSRTGQGVRVAIVDSGVNFCHSHVGGPAKGVSVSETAQGFELSGEVRDSLGHGTAAAGVVRWWAPECELVAVRILQERWGCSAALAQEGVQEAARLGADLILLSLSGPRDCGWSEFPQDVPLVAAACNEEGGGYPACLPWVLGVASSEHPRQFRRFAGPIRYGAPPQPRPLPGLRPNFQGTSFAAAHVAGVVAKILECRPAADVAGCLDALFTS